MEKKIKKTSKGTKSVSYNNEEKTIIFTIVVALVIIGSLLVYLIFTPIEPEYFSTIYYLDSEKSTENLPKTVVLEENSTFSLWVGVENHNGTAILYQVKFKMEIGDFLGNYSQVETKETYEKRLKNGDVWEFIVPIEIEQLGNNIIVFDLCAWNGTQYKSTGSWVTLSVEAV